MRVSIISFTENGILLSEKIAEVLQQKNVSEILLFTKCTKFSEEQNGKISFTEKAVGEWAKEQMEEKNALLFIGACGIAVRAIAPHITDKLQDSPVLVMDEKGQYVIPILSGHVGGANELVLVIAKRTGAVPVITTATDLQRKFAVDLFAKKNGLFIANKDGIARVSSKVLAGQNVTISVESGHVEKDCKLPDGVQLAAYPPAFPVDIVVTSEEKEFDSLICLKPREYVIGMGCKRGKEAEKVEAFIRRSIEELGIETTQIGALASIDLKKEEQAFLSWSRKEKLPFFTYTAEELQKVEGAFHKSNFVKDRVGVDNVCERAALKACEPCGELVYEKHAEDGMTIAIAKREWRVSFDEA